MTCLLDRPVSSYFVAHTHCDASKIFYCLNMSEYNIW